MRALMRGRWVGSSRSERQMGDSFKNRGRTHLCAMSTVLLPHQSLRSSLRPPRCLATSPPHHPRPSYTPRLAPGFLLRHPVSAPLADDARPRCDREQRHRHERLHPSCYGSRLYPGLSPSCKRKTQRKKALSGGESNPGLPRTIVLLFPCSCEGAGKVGA
jgi:hypothetical protein